MFCLASTVRHTRFVSAYVVFTARLVFDSLRLALLLHFKGNVVEPVRELAVSIGLLVEPADFIAMFRADEFLKMDVE